MSEHKSESVFHGRLPAPRHGDVRHGVTLSDLHLFRERSRGEEALHQVRDVIRNADFIVLNGDIFDFRWSCFPTIAATEDAAVQWLRKFVEDLFPVTVFYILGNHDCHRGFRQRLANEPNLFNHGRWFSAFLRVGSALFLHGDLPLFRPLKNCLQRSESKHPRQAGALMRLWNTGVIYPLFGRLAPLVFPMKWSSRQVVRSVLRHGERFRHHVKDICFGHIHYPFTDVPVRRVRTHNTGSPLPGFQWQAVTVTTEDPTWEGR